MITDGLSWWQAWVCVWLGYGIVAPFIVLNARPGAIQHITFPVVARTSFGLWGSLWCTFNRGAMACIWYGVQASIGGSCVLVMLRSMWPSVQNIRGCGTKYACPAFVHRKSHRSTIAGIAFFVWSIVKAKVLSNHPSPAKLHGSELGWVMVKSLMSCISNMATLVVNAPDFASRAHRPSNAVMPQLISVPLGFSLVSFLGIIVSSSSEVIYGEPVWSPVDSLENSWTEIPVMRHDLDRRGGYIAAIVGLAMCPWQLLKDSNSFTSYLSAYSVFLSSIAGVMITEYWLIRRGHYRIADLYHTERTGWYWYTLGINPKAYVAYISGILINVVGFAGPTVPLAATRIYQMAFFTGFGVSSIIYYVLNRIWPSPGSWQTFEEVDESGWHPVEEHRRDSEEEDSYSVKKQGDDAFVREVPVA
ncbi:Permease for cytosine/purines, uracil, thiamine, allantoin [Rhizoctonia solani]|uniref:Permease for cytosine/purines, uracil, thiamine, allantoin n=1 Tax=Rhizoctonia solani TaxID=456999 RepID=A0A8H7IKJ7_9AGAM|nr:Permease for cytosine/purines, uracil, thiamine, allantoin [Rhizoctonia solani]